MLEKAGREGPVGIGMSQVTVELIPIRRPERIWAEELELRSPFRKPPTEAEDGASFPPNFMQLSPQAAEKRVSEEVPILVGVGSVEKGRCPAEEVEGIWGQANR